MADTKARRVVLVCGGRTFGEDNHLDALAASAYLSDMHKAKPISLVVEGGATGADALARTWCDFARVSCCTMRADWARYGRSAGPRRNEKMLSYLLQNRDNGADVLVVAFPGGRGTADMVARAKGAGLPVEEPFRV